ncbi:MAG TPA: hypothetical protein VFQ60_00745 [Patescibacteria group bacterium]|nr:hypothetical protein [Patescibacteria group bacterium]
MQGAPLASQMVSSVTTVQTPSMTAQDFLKDLCREPDLRLGHGFADWNFYLGPYGNLVGGSGKRFRVRIWHTDRELSTDQVRAESRRISHQGHVGSFLAWCRSQKDVLRGRFTTIPPDIACRRLSERGALLVPVWHAESNSSVLTLEELMPKWESGWYFFDSQEITEFPAAV